MAQRSIINKLIGISTQVSRRQFISSFEKCENEVRLIGRAGNDAQTKGSFEHPVVQFTLATHSNYKYDDDAKQKTQWHRVAVFKPGLRQLAEEYVKKGTRISIKGKIEYGEIIDAQGKSKPTTTIIADDIIFLTKSNKTETVNKSDLDEYQGSSY